MKHQELFKKETYFHDNWAESVNMASIDVDSFSSGPAALENRHIFERIGSVKGKRVLDIGCGLGESSVMFAKRGAVVVASDISPQMIACAKRLAAHHRVMLETRVGPAETLNFHDSEFDIIYTANTIHHLADKKAFLGAAAKYLKPDGVFISWDPVKYNPIINIYRKMADKVRTEDETPLDLSDARMIKAYFPKLETTHFWLLGLALFIKYFLLDRINPNAERYWKKIYSETAGSLWWWRPLVFLDGLMLKLPLIRWLSWNIVIIGRKTL